jgi:hypothetical protein
MRLGAISNLITHTGPKPNAAAVAKLRIELAAQAQKNVAPVSPGLDRCPVGGAERDIGYLHLEPRGG